MIKKLLVHLCSKKIQVGISIGFLLSCSVELTAQQPFQLVNISQAFDFQRKQNLQEKIFVHTDKSFYVAGEIIWFKLYYVDGVFNRPFALSKIAYVDVLDKDQKPVLQAKIGLDSGRGKGSFFIPVNLTSGNYTFRAYTNWMKNFSADFYFTKDITVVNALKKLPEKLLLTTAGFEIHFFPEGGNLVNGLESKVGFKVTDQQGRGVDHFQGTIIDQNNITVASFEPRKFGMGQFLFKPVAGNKYSAIIKVGASNALISDFPAAFEYGYVMRMEEQGKDSLRIRVLTNLDEAGQYIFLFAHTRQVIKFAEAKTFENGQAIFYLNKNTLGEGISHLTLFNRGQKAVCERLCFKKPQQLHIEAQTVESEYGTRKKITINIRTQARDNKFIPADMSMAVYLLDSLQGSQRENILSYLWLSSDIKGRIESPEYYFSDTGPETGENTDILMLTQGWRRFRWEELLKNTSTQFEFIPEPEGHIVNGKIISKKNGLPLEGITAYLSAPSQRFQLSSSVSTKDGLLQFNIRDFSGSNEIVLQAASFKDTGNRIDIFSPFSEKFSDVPAPRFQLSETMQQDLLQHSIGTQVQNVFFTDRLQKFVLDKNPDSSAFFGQPDKRYYLDDYTRFNTMEEVMREYVSDVTVHRRQRKFYFKVLNEPKQTFFDEEPLMLVDGVVVLDADNIMQYNPLKVKKIEVVGRQYYHGSAIASGIISYSTFKGDLEGFQIDPSSIVLEYEGLQLERAFYSPAYDASAKTSSRLPDFRNVLYWSPDLKTDLQGYHQVNFYSSDRPGKYMVVLQGITSAGDAGAKYLTFDVNNP